MNTCRMLTAALVFGTLAFGANAQTFSTDTYADQGRQLKLSMSFGDQPAIVIEGGAQLAGANGTLILGLRPMDADPVFGLAVVPLMNVPFKLDESGSLRIPVDLDPLAALADATVSDKPDTIFMQAVVLKPSDAQDTTSWVYTSNGVRLWVTSSDARPTDA